MNCPARVKFPQTTTSRQDTDKSGAIRLHIHARKLIKGFPLEPTSRKARNKGSPGDHVGKSDGPKNPVGGHNVVVEKVEVKQRVLDKDITAVSRLEDAAMDLHALLASEKKGAGFEGVGEGVVVVSSRMAKHGVVEEEGVLRGGGAREGPEERVEDARLRRYDQVGADLGDLPHGQRSWWRSRRHVMVLGLDDDDDDDGKAGLSGGSWRNDAVGSFDHGGKGFSLNKIFNKKSRNKGN